MRVVSWNVNGLRACVKKGFLDVLEASEADVWLLQEVRAFPEQLPRFSSRCNFVVAMTRGYQHCPWVSAH